MTGCAPDRKHHAMRILVTGGTGFVGSHIVLALQERGHDVRLLARRREQVTATFAPHDVKIRPEAVVVGDVLDADAVTRALEDCEAVVHAAAVFTFDPRRSAEMIDTNAAATRLVLTKALEQGCDPVVHISSTVALTRRAGSGPDLPLGDIPLPYSRSKVASEEVARVHQAAGRPVVTVYPGAVYGPHDPYRGEQTARLAWIARGLFPLWPSGGLHSVDVRDVAAVVASAVEKGRGPRRFIVPGHHVNGPQLFAAVSAATGRRRPRVPLAPRLAVASTRAIDAVQSRLPEGWRYPADREGTEIILRDTRFDSSATERELGVTARPFEDSVRDTLAWMVEDGRLPARFLRR